MQNFLPRMRRLVKTTPLLSVTTLGTILAQDGNLMPDLAKGRRLSKGLAARIEERLSKLERLDVRQRNAAAVEQHQQRKFAREASADETVRDDALRELKRVAKRLEKIQASLQVAAVGIEQVCSRAESRGVDIRA